MCVCVCEYIFLPGFVVVSFTKEERGEVGELRAREFFVYSFSSFFWGIYGNDILLFYLVRKMQFVPKKIISSQNFKTAFYSYTLER